MLLHPRLEQCHRKGVEPPWSLAGTEEKGPPAVVLAPPLLSLILVEDFAPPLFVPPCDRGDLTLFLARLGQIICLSVSDINSTFKAPSNGRSARSAQSAPRSWNLTLLETLAVYLRCHSHRQPDYCTTFQ